MDPMDALSTLLGLDAETLTWRQMSARAIVMYLAALAMIRIGEKRFLGKSTAFDVILGIIIGSVASRAINGSAAFGATIVAGVVLVGMHWLLAWLSFRWSAVGTVVKGSTRTLVEDGAIRWDEMRKSHVSEHDLLSALRTQGRVEGVEGVKLAMLERSGAVSVIAKDDDGKDDDGKDAAPAPRVVYVDVASGVQRIRIELG